MPRNGDSPFVDKYRPEQWDDVQGNTKSIEAIQKWLRDFPNDSRPRLLHGKQGTGKTSTSEVAANEMGWDLVEINASSARTTDDVEDMAKVIRGQGEERRVILIDEIDSWDSSTDKTRLYDALENPPNPVFLTANEKYHVPDGIKNRAVDHQFKLNISSRRAKLKEVIAEEGLDVDDDDLEQLAQRDDLRSAINDLQIYAYSDGIVEADGREMTTSEWDMVDNIMARGVRDLGDNSPKWAVLWLDENVSVDYRGLELAWAYEAMSIADQFLLKAQRDDYRYWRYAAPILEEIARLRRTEPYKPESGIWGKDFPEWLRHSEPKATGSDAEARLYRALKDYEDGGFRFDADFITFTETHLPVLRALDAEQKYQLILEERLSPDEYRALDVQRSEYEEWLEVEAPETGEWGGKTEDAAAW